MLDIKFIRENIDTVRKGAESKGVEIDLGFVLSLDERRRELIQESEQIKSDQNKVSKEVASQKDEQKRKETIESMQRLKEKFNKLKDEKDKVEDQLDKLLRQIPNMPLDDVPLGKNESGNVVLREEGEKPDFKFKPKSYLELAENLDLIDIERAAKVSGSRFGYLKREAALLEFALVQLIFEMVSSEEEVRKIINEKQLKISAKPFIPVVPPVMIKPEMMKAMGFMDRDVEADEIYHLEKDNVYLVGTSEQSVGPMHQGEILKEDDLPLRYASFSSCFRREAGAYGKDTKGILRVHQFDKLEMFIFCKPDDSREEHELLLGVEERIMRKLGLPYRVLLLCTGDISMSSAKTYDIEAWMPGQNGGEGEYRETHSTSNTTDFQTRRLNIRYKTERDGKKVNEYTHALNGTASAFGRMIISILENYQQEDGSIAIPEVLQKYMGGREKIG